jgi:hypothetical protein
MNKFIAIVAAPLFLISIAIAEGATPQQQKMKECNAEASSKTLKGEERQAFMKILLVGERSRAHEEGNAAAGENEGL